MEASVIERSELSGVASAVLSKPVLSRVYLSQCSPIIASAVLTAHQAYHNAVCS